MWRWSLNPNQPPSGNAAINIRNSVLCVLSCVYRLEDYSVPKHPRVQGQCGVERVDETFSLTTPPAFCDGNSQTAMLGIVLVASSDLDHGNVIGSAECGRSVFPRALAYSYGNPASIQCLLAIVLSS